MKDLPKFELHDYHWEEGHPIPQIEIELRGDGAVCWINFNGICIFRACNLPEGTDISVANQSPADKKGYMWQDRQSGELGSIVYDNPGRVEEGGIPWRVPVEVRILQNEESTRTPDSKVQG